MGIYLFFHFAVKLLRIIQRHPGQKEGSRMDGQMDRFPLRAAALLSLNFNHKILKQGTGNADDLLPLGC